ncbi:MAG: dihydrodipicolinate synthase family protein, partial [Draconibacterium sp.]|nr:dihydrodipicolinate synthase family protein [Draconibacterium sp.]
MQREKIVGLISAPFTPMSDNGKIKIETIKPYADKLKADGLSGVFVCGTTGEGMLMTSEERKLVAEAWLKEQTPGFKVIVHVGSTSVEQSRLLAEHAQKNGAFGTGAMGPMFLKPAGINELVDFCAKVASGASDLPFYYYHIPSISGINFSMNDFLIEASSKIPNLAGIKFTDNNFMEMQKCVNLDKGKWDILHGFDEMLLGGLSFGVKGAVGSTYNYAAPLYLEIFEAFKGGNIEKSRRLQLQSVELVDVLLKHGGALVAGKAIMKLVGVDCGPCRLPLRKISNETEQRLKKDLEQL